VDAADIMLFNPFLQTLEWSAGRGFRSKPAEGLKQRLGEGYAGRAALEHRIIAVTRLAKLGQTAPLPGMWAGEHFVTYYAVPLIAKGQVKGVLNIYHRAPLDPDLEWTNFLETLSTQAAIAIDNATLFDNLQRANAELALAYDATIEGWSRALDLRDHATEGHTQRVTEMTLHLARAMGIKDHELVHIRRGALLHDIGKMGISDTILLKPDRLREDEWEIVRKHPTHAYELLSPIFYLVPALDIPYCHHEKWDGTGYPRGLKGEGIPLAARMFAVADVWDALTSDRYYRKAWPREKVRQYIREQSGIHFDPKVVEVFLRLQSTGVLKS
jgi:putative nucleotidyltransferase with HDIG domain